MKVIGAGLPRTGTLTQKLALEHSALGPATTGSTSWQTSTGRSRCGTARWMARLRGRRCSPAAAPTVDWPGGYFYRELIDAYPEAKVLLSVRDPESWERSFRETIVDMCHGESLMRLLSSARGEIDPRWHSYLALVDRMFWGELGTFAAGHSPEQLIERMIAHNEDVKRAIPAERLLVWKVTDGWEPLCEFLEVDVPAEPLPHVNDRDTFLERVTDGALDALQAWRERSLKTDAAPA